VTLKLNCAGLFTSVSLTRRELFTSVNTLLGKEILQYFSQCNYKEKNLLESERNCPNFCRFFLKKCRFIQRKTKTKSSKDFCINVGIFSLKTSGNYQQTTKTNCQKLSSHKNLSLI